MSARPEGAERERALESEVALIARDEFAQRAADTGVEAREVDHARGEGRADEVAVEASAHPRGALQLAPEVRAPAPLVIGDAAREVAVREQLGRAQRVVDALARDGVCEAGGVAEQSPVVTADAARVERLRREAGDARRVTLDRLAQARFD